MGLQMAMTQTPALLDSPLAGRILNTINSMHGSTMFDVARLAAERIRVT